MAQCKNQRLLLLTTENVGTLHRCHWIMDHWADMSFRSDVSLHPQWLRSGKQECAAKVSSFHMVSDTILLNFVLCSLDYLQIIGVCLSLVQQGNGFGASLLHLHCTILNGSQCSLGYSGERLSVLASGVWKSFPWLDVFRQNAVAVWVQGLIHNLQWKRGRPRGKVRWEEEGESIKKSNGCVCVFGGRAEGQGSK